MPLSEKKDPLAEIEIPTSLEELFGPSLSIPPAIKADLEKRELDARWIDRKRYIAEGSYHKRGYQAYQVTEDVKLALSKSGFPSDDPDGFVRRDSCILGVRPLARALQHRAYLRKMAQEYNPNTNNKKKATQIREQLKEDGLGKDVRVTEGYNEN